MKYRPEIDGLRSLAILSVVLYHLGIGLPGGYVGVDVFFVISGFLITQIIRRHLEGSVFSFAVFWERRVRRIFPALFLVLAAILIVGYWLLPPYDLVELGDSSVAQALLGSNIYFWQETGYFAGAAEYKPLLHTWSLAVEEQFYLFLPLGLYFLRRASNKSLFVLLGILALASFVASSYGAIFYPAATFYLLPTRAWELLSGCMLAVLPWQIKPSTWRDRAIASLGMLGIILPIFFYNDQMPFPGLAAAPPVLGTAAIIFSTERAPTLWLTKLLSIWPLVFIGLISYSLYLWHWPIIVYTRIYFGHFHWLQAVFAAVLSFGFATLSWKFIETPIRKRILIKSRKALLYSVGILVISLISISLIFAKTGGLPSRFPKYSPVLNEDTKYPGERFGSSIEHFQVATLPVLGVKEKDLCLEKRIDFIVWGDSHAMMLGEVMDIAARENGLTGLIVASPGQVPGPGLVFRYNNALYTKKLMDWMDVNRPRNLILVNRWSSRTNGRNETEKSYRKDGEAFLSDNTTTAQTFEEASEVLARSLQNLADFCEERSITLWIVKQVPEISEPNPAKDMLMYSLGKTRDVPRKTTSIYQHLDRQDRPNRIFARINSRAIRLVDPAPCLFNKKSEVPIFREGRSNYWDEDHLTGWGASLLLPIFSEMFAEMKIPQIQPKLNPINYANPQGTGSK